MEDESPAPMDPWIEPCSDRGRWLIVVGGLVCFAAMWLPLFDDFVPMRDEYGLAFALCLLVPAFALPRTANGVRVMRAVARLLLIASGLVGSVGLVIIGQRGAIALMFLPAPLAVLVIGWIGPRLARLTIMIALVTLFACLAFVEDAGVGLPVLAIGAVALLIGALLWGRKPFYDPTVSKTLPHAVAVRTTKPAP